MSNPHETRQSRPGEKDWRENVYDGPGMPAKEWLDHERAGGYAGRAKGFLGALTLVVGPLALLVCIAALLFIWLR